MFLSRAVYVIELLLLKDSIPIRPGPNGCAPVNVWRSVYWVTALAKRAYWRWGGAAFAAASRDGLRPAPARNV
jgi:hypothetical protein